MTTMNEHYGDSSDYLYCDKCGMCVTCGDCTCGGKMKLDELPTWPQRQDSTAEQLADLRRIANRLGFHDAADAIAQWCDGLPEIKYGCHCDLEPHMEPDGCVIDSGELHNCIYAKKVMRKEQCEYWKIVVPKDKR